MQKALRFKQFDILRGTAVIFMISTHAASILFAGKSMVLDQIMTWGVTVSFTIFLFSSAIVYGYKASEEKINQIKSLKRSFLYLTWYFLLAVFVASFGYDKLVNTDQLIEILTFKYLPPYTEFVVAFVLYGMLIFLLGNRGLKSLGKVWIFVATLVGSYLLSNYLYSVDFGSDSANAIKSLFVGHKNIHSFGILSYMPIFLVGNYLGQLIQSKRFPRFLIAFALLTAIGFFIEMLLTGYEMLRWPPNVQFLAVGLIYSLLFLLLFSRPFKDNILTNYLAYIGTYAFEFFVYHVVVLFSINVFPDLRYTNPIWYVPAFIGTMFVSQLLTALTVTARPLLNTRAPMYVNYLIYPIFLVVVVVFAFGAGITYQQARNFEERQIIYKDFLNSVRLPNECIPLPQDFLGRSTVDRKWYLTGTEFTQQEKTIQLKANYNIDIYRVVYNERPITYKFEVIGKQVQGVAVLDELKSLIHADVDYSELPAGNYAIAISADNGCSTVYSTTKVVTVSYPVYVAWTIDWEGYFINQQYIKEMFAIADEYEIPMTHFFNPRYFANSEMGDATRQAYTKLVTDRVKNNGDAVGLHIHAFNDLMLSSGVAEENILTEPAWGGAHSPGYDIPFGNYSYEDQVKVINWSKQQFINRGLGNPIMFRAGGWQANSTTLKALEDTGFVLDSSGRTYTNFGPNKLGVPWSLSATTQPYRPNLYNQNSSASPTMRLWEFPNNGGDSWAFSGAQMVGRFDLNYDGKFAKSRTSVNFLTHPEGFKVDKPKLEQLFDHIGQNLYADDKGPVKYLNMIDVYNIYNK